MSFNSKYSGQQVEELLDMVNQGGVSSNSYPLLNHGSGDTTFTLTPNTYHVWDEVLSLDLSFGEEGEGVVSEFVFQFTSGGTATTLSLPDTIQWVEQPTIEANKTYQVSIVNNIGLIVGV